MIRFPEGIDAEQFLRDYWQRKPLLIRQGLPGFHSPLDGDELAGLALEEDVESRIVMEQGFDGPWELHHGPFGEADFRRLPDDSPWTLLVQAVDLWLPEVRALIDEFDFLPRWRIDDIMVSYANDRGGVGPHFDHYDVFLVQGSGKRRWQVGPSCDETSPLLEGTPLKILADFQATAEYILEPGDILYLPPRVAHLGEAVGECMTYSVGFRAPTGTEMLSDLATELASRDIDLDYRDPPLTPDMASDTIDPAFIREARKVLYRILDDETLLGEWFASYMTAPRYPDLDADEPAQRRRAWLSGKPSRLFENGIEIPRPEHGG
jgi:50S ribosomal protein L16 3-hydroxylase